MTAVGPLNSAVLPAGKHSHFLDHGNGLRVHFHASGTNPPRKRQADAALRP